MSAAICGTARSSGLRLLRQCVVVCLNCVDGLHRPSLVGKLGLVAHCEQRYTGRLELRMPRPVRAMLACDDPYSDDESCKFPVRKWTSQNNCNEIFSRKLQQGGATCLRLYKLSTTLLKKREKQTDPKLTSDDFFELFVSDLVTRDFGLDWDDIEFGVVDGENDGQVDAVYILVDGMLIREKKEFDPKVTRRNANVRVIVHQSKNSASFPENSFAKMRTTVCDLFNLDNKLAQLKKAYNSALVAQVDLFWTIYLGMQGKNPIVQFDIVFASKGDRATASAKVRTDSKAVVEF